MLIPFGSGVRTCPGKSLAEIVQNLIFSFLLLRFDFSLDVEQFEKPVNDAMNSNDIMLSVEFRNPMI